MIENIDQLRHLKILFKDTNHGFFYRDGLWLLLPNQRKLMLNNDLTKLNSVEPRSIINESISINQNDKKGILGLGWSHPNYGRTIGSNGVWSEGHYSNFIFKINGSKISSMTIFLKQVFTDKNSNLKIQILINNREYKKLNLNQKNKKIELSNIEDYLLDGDNIVSINIQNPSTPLSKLTSIDGRLLGILVEKVLFN